MRKAGGAVKGFAARVEGMGRRMRAALRNTGMGNVAARLRGLGTSIAGFAGIYGVGQAIKQVRDFEDSLADLAIFSRKMETAGPGWIDKVRKNFYKLSNDTGIAKEQLAAFANTFVTLTGDADAAMGSLEAMAKISVATGADMSDLAQVMSRLSGSLGIKNAKELTQSFAIMAYQANKGAMSFKDIAAAMPTIAGIASGAFGARGVEGVKGIGGLLQMAARVKGAGGAQTSVAAFLSQLVLKRKEAQALLGYQAELGTETAEGKFKWKSLSDISKMIGEAFAKGTAEQKEKWMRIFRMRGAGTLLALGGAAKAGWGEKAGTAEAAKKIFGAEEAGGLIKKMYGERMKTAGQRIRKTMNELTNQIHLKLLPAFQALAKHMPTIAKGFSWLITNIESLIRVWAIWKVSRFFMAMRNAPGQMAAMMGAGGGGVYGPGGQAALLYGMGGAGAKPGAKPPGRGMQFATMATKGLIAAELAGMAVRTLGPLMTDDPEDKKLLSETSIWNFHRKKAEYYRRKAERHEEGLAGGQVAAGASTGAFLLRAMRGELKPTTVLGEQPTMRAIEAAPQRAMQLEQTMKYFQLQAAAMAKEGKTGEEIAQALPELANLRKAIRILDETMKRLKEGIPLEGANTPDGRAKQRQNAQAQR